MSLSETGVYKGVSGHVLDQFITFRRHGSVIAGVGVCARRLTTASADGDDRFERAQQQFAPTHFRYKTAQTRDKLRRLFGEVVRVHAFVSFSINTLFSFKQNLQRTLSVVAA
ncbi:unnamed protein product [Sphagnum balticum]